MGSLGISVWVEIGFLLLFTVLSYTFEFCFLLYPPEGVSECFSDSKDSVAEESDLLLSEELPAGLQ